MILTGQEIRKALADGRIQVDPFVDEHINANSLDLRLGDEVAVYAAWCWRPDGWVTPPAEDGSDLRPMDNVLDVRAGDPEVYRMRISPEKGWMLKPGISYLMHTKEKIRTDHYVPIVDGKSTVGRLFISVHETAGFGDPGFDGQYTLEVTCRHPVRVFPDMRFCQIRFHAMLGEPMSYQDLGQYVGAASIGPVPARPGRLLPPTMRMTGR